MTQTATRPDWQRWYERWEAQQAHHMPDREERFEVITAALAVLAGEAPLLVDLGSGPGSLAQRILAAIPRARAVAVDLDPVLLAIGRNALGDLDGRLTFLDADLRDPWESRLHSPVDAAVSTTALHWLQPPDLASLYARLAGVLRPGGVLLNGDSLGFDAEPTIAAAVPALRAAQSLTGEPAAAAGESWEEWWASALAEPGFAAEAAERARRHHDHPEHSHQAGYAFHRQALLDAGFREVTTIWQRLSNRVLVAVR
ncbi:MAG: class I SAM-dependent methyltransferase [Candidatus Dormibacteria bacterium]